MRWTFVVRTILFRLSFSIFFLSLNSILFFIQFIFHSIFFYVRKFISFHKIHLIHIFFLIRLPLNSIACFFTVFVIIQLYGTLVRFRRCRSHSVAAQLSSLCSIIRFARMRICWLHSLNFVAAVNTLSSFASLIFSCFSRIRTYVTKCVCMWSYIHRCGLRRGRSYVSFRISLYRVS